jgi:hypothetical protein
VFWLLRVAVAELGLNGACTDVRAKADSVKDTPYPDFSIGSACSWHRNSTLFLPAGMLLFA